VEAKRFIWTNATGKHNFYVSTESFYTHSISNIFTTYVNIGGGVFYDDYTVNKDVVGLNLKIGKQFMFNHFLLELYGGLGVSTTSPPTSTPMITANPILMSYKTTYLGKENTSS